MMIFVCSGVTKSLSHGGQSLAEGGPLAKAQKEVKSILHKKNENTPKNAKKQLKNTEYQNIN